MKRTILVLTSFTFFLFLAGASYAAHLATDPEACDYYVVTGLPASFTAAQMVSGDPTGAAGMSLDLSGLPAVASDTQFTVTVQCCRSGDATHTGACSAASAPFTFTQTPTPGAPTGETLIP